MLQVTDAAPAGDYRISIRFSDGAEGIADLSSVLWGPVFEPLREPAAFARFRISPDTGTLEWPNGADLAPEALVDLIRISTTA